MKSTIRILIADHDRWLAAATRRCLELQGYTVLVATDGINCVDELHTLAPSLLVLDAEILWREADGVLDLLIHEEPLLPLSVAVVESSDNQQIPESLNPRIDCRLQRPKTINDLLPFVHRLEELAQRVVSSNRDSQMKLSHSSRM